ncbi:hypothetical protein D4764_15G0006880 [Takifugu flavidus]|uniref:Uncharacterized protein n=1 Tax=Takifugu flavidus TaxID=433684 RepID=A0A5C6P0K2_9TELE|nr:hypothetical protein D4764_15G0006880 [Takifugu flavidus]
MGRQREHPRDFESPENGLVLKERAYWKKQLHELQEKYDKQGRQLFYAEQHNRDLNDKLQQAKELNKKKDEEKASLQQQLDLRKGFNQKGEIQDERNGVDEQPKKVDVGLQTVEMQDELNGVDEQPKKVDVSLQTGEIQEELNGVDEQPKKVDVGLQTGEIQEELNGVDEQPKKVDVGLQTVEMQDKLNGVDEQPKKVDVGLQTVEMQDELNGVDEQPKKVDVSLQTFEMQDELNGVDVQPKKVDIGLQTVEIQEELNGVDDKPKKVDIGLQMNIPLNDINDSQELQNSEGSLEEEVGQPREVLPEREEQFREKSLRNEAHVDTLALLTQTEAALRESEEKSSRLEKELQEIVSEQGEKQLSRKEESVSMEPCGPDNQAINQLYDLCDHWENIINQMMETERKVQEEKKLQKLEETRLQQEIQHLHVKKVQLQTVNAETELMGRRREHPRDFESPENGLVLKERAYWKKQLHELQQKYDKQGRQLFYAEQHNRDLNDKLQQAKELNKKKDEEKASLQQQLDLRKGFNQKGEIQDEQNGVDEQPKKVDVGLQTGEIQEELNGVDEQPKKVDVGLQTGEMQDELNGVDEQPKKVDVSLQTVEMQDELNGVDEQPKKVDVSLQTVEMQDELNGVDEQPKKVDVGLQTGEIQDELNGVDEQPKKVDVSLQTVEMQDELNGVDEQPKKVDVGLQTGEIQEELNGVDEQPKKVDVGLQTGEIQEELNGVDEQPKKVDVGLQTSEIQDELNGVDEQPKKVDVGLQTGEIQEELNGVDEQPKKVDVGLQTSEIQDELNGVDEQPKKVDVGLQTVEIQDELNGVDDKPKVDIGLQINIPLNDINDSQELQNSEGSLEEEVGQPREVLPEREEQFREKSLRNEAHVDTLALLTQTEAALRESEEKSSRLEKELQEIVSEQGEKQLSRKEESVSMEPCGPDNQAINQLYDLCDHWENIINQMMETERKVQEEKKLQKLEETRLQQEIQHLHVKKVQLQVGDSPQDPTLFI